MLLNFVYAHLRAQTCAPACSGAQEHGGRAILMPPI